MFQSVYPACWLFRVHSWIISIITPIILLCILKCKNQAEKDNIFSYIFYFNLYNAFILLLVVLCQVEIKQIMNINCKHYQGSTLIRFVNILMYCYVILAHKNLMQEECSYLDNSFKDSDIFETLNEWTVKTCKWFKVTI